MCMWDPLGQNDVTSCIIMFVMGIFTVFFPFLSANIYNICSWDKNMGELETMIKLGEVLEFIEHHSF